jgi:ribosome-binding factor A
MSHRTEKVASVIRQVVSQAIATKLSDPRIARFVSVTRVEVSGDLMHAAVYISVMGNETDERKTMAGLEHARGFLQTMLSKKLTTRHCPQIRLVVDKGLKKQIEILEKLDQISAELAQVDAERQSHDAVAEAAESPDGPDEPEDSQTLPGTGP